MPVFTITYTTQQQADETDWVCPEGYTTHKAMQTFCQQHPSAMVNTIIRMPEQENRNG